MRFGTQGRRHRAERPTCAAQKHPRPSLAPVSPLPSAVELLVPEFTGVLELNNSFWWEPTRHQPPEPVNTETDSC